MTAEIHFHSNNRYSLGVELELQILDKETLNLTPKAPTILESVPEAYKEKIKFEFTQAMVEATSSVCDNITEVADDLSTTCLFLEKLAAAQNSLIFASSLHPFAKYREQKISSNPRYEEIMQELQITGRRLISQGLHVHVGLPSSETAIKVFNSIRQFLPILLAMSCSSPFYQGEDSGFESYRVKLFEALPRTGIPGDLTNWNEFIQVLHTLREAGIIRGIKDIWWDVRPHPDFGTIEIRVCDLPHKLNDTMAIVALIHSLVVALAENKIHSPASHREILTNNKWQAARHGLSGKFIQTPNGQSPSLATAAQELLDRLTPVAKDIGANSYLSRINHILQTGSSSQYQRKIHKKERSHRAIIEILQKEFWQ